ncbi:MAG: hypothetical protein RLZZ298_3075 [Pseudomonadota bacterium]
MSKKAMSRSEKIQCLVARSVKTAVLESPTHWLNKIFEDGFVGYSRLSDSQLTMEMEMHGLFQSEDPFDEELEETDEFYATNLIFS